MYDYYTEDCMIFIQSTSRPSDFFGGKVQKQYFCKQNEYKMKSYIKFLSRNKLYATIEVLGLSIALAFVIILVSYANMEYRVGSNQKLAKELYAIGTGEDLAMTWGTAKKFFPSIPEIKEWTRFSDYYVDQGVVVNGKYFKPTVLAVDTNFLQMFDYRLRGCSSRRILTDERQAIISETFAKKAFGVGNPIGQSIRCADKQWKIVGVMQDFDQDEVLKHSDILVSMKLKEASLHPMRNFGQVTTVVRLTKSADPKKLEATLLDKYMKYWKDWKPTKENGSILWGSTVVRWDKIYFSSVTNFNFRQGNLRLVNILLVVAFVLLLSALFNYVNLTLAQTGNRAKEMATRRLLGEQVTGVMLRYLRESALFTACCVLLGIFMAWVLTPLFNQVLETKIALLASSEVWLGLLGTYCVVTLLSGVLPAIVVSRLNPIHVVKGTVRLHSKMWIDKVFIVVQHVISMTLVVMALTMMLQMRHLTHLPLGYQTKDIALVNTPFWDDSGKRMAALVKRLKMLPECELVAAARATPFNGWNNGVLWNGKEVYVHLCGLDTVGMRMLGFKVLERYSAPTKDKLWLSRDAQRAYGVSRENPRVGDKDYIGSYEVCGVVADYHSGDALNSLDKDEHNAILMISGTAQTSDILIKTCGDHAQALQAIRRTCKQVAKEQTGVPLDMEVGYWDDRLADSLKSNHNMMVLVLTFMGISILVSALGLFGMSVYDGNQQKRQVALRKVMGATIGDVVWQLTRRYFACSVVAVIIAIPICEKLMRHYLMDFAYRIDFPGWLLLVGAGFTLLVTLVSVIGRALSIALSNPIDSIKTE